MDSFTHATLLRIEGCMRCMKSTELLPLGDARGSFAKGNLCFPSDFRTCPEITLLTYFAPDAMVFSFQRVRDKQTLMVPTLERPFHTYIS
mmetsp:Transcript_251/g.352  ORF Transcript_251/g.352 Transcript_251/m.352 type:complete len:90 (+) Transcript_251:874-1143(+)